MKTLALVLPLIALSACQQNPQTTVDDPRRTAADAVVQNTIFGASGISGLAYVGAAQLGDGANLSYDKRYTTNAELAAAPANVCAELNGTVDTVRDELNPADFLDDNFRVLYIKCNV